MANETQTSSPLSAEQKRALLADLLKRRARESRAIHPLSHNQRAMWFLHRLDPANVAYNVAFAARIDHRIDPVVLRECLDTLVARHQALRTTFIQHHDEPFQEIHGFMEMDFETVEAAGLDEESLHRLVTREYIQPFDLEKGPLLRARLFQRAEGESRPILLMVVHHIAIDGWSLRILIEQLRILHAQKTNHANDVPLAPVEAEYIDYVNWQQEMLESPDGQELREFWHEHLAGRLPELDLPLDPAADRAPGARGDSHHFEIRDVVPRLEALARAERTTLFAVLLAAYQALLHRYSGQEDILVGTPTLGRSRAEYEGTVGDFINPVVMRGNLSGDPSFRELVGRLRGVVQGALAGQDYPFSLLVEELAPRRDPDTNPIYQAMFNLHQPHRFAGREGIEIKRNGGAVLDLDDVYPLNQQEGQLLLTLEMVEHDGWLGATFKYSTRHFQPATVQRIERHFQTLLRGIAQNPDLPLSQIPLLDESERSLLLEEWNLTGSDYPRDANLLDLIVRQAERVPDSPAVRFAGRSLTYAQLIEQVDRLAHRLARSGAEPGALVGVCLNRSEQMLVSLLAVLRAGAAYVPIDPAYPADRIAYMLEDSKARLLVTEESLAREFESIQTPRLLIDEAETGGNGSGAHELPSPAADDLAYVIYTSGSTGKPKGVQITHRALNNFLLSMQAEPGLGEHDILLAVTTLSFDIAGLELYLPLIAGASVVIAPAETVTDAAALARTIEHEAVTVMQATPATWRLLLDNGWRGDPRLKALCGGEALPRDLVNRLEPLVAEMWNLYGPTETTIWSTVHRVEAGEGPVLIGRPIANTQIYILDSHLAPVPIGVAGELFIGGEGLAVGYLDRPELTAERFVPDPFRENERIYRTGDLARYRPDGTIECLGRVDFQVKVRGYRIELGEIENVLDSHPDVRQSVVVARDFAAGDRRLIAFYTPADSASPPARDLRAHLAENLPAYMMPSAYVRLDAMPLTPNGKVDRKALPEVDGLDAGEKEEYRPPRDEAETLLADIWATVLKVDRVGIDDSFFDLGGHSLLATQLISRVNKTFNVELPLRAIFEHSTVAGLADAVDHAQRQEIVPLPPIQPADRDKPVRLSFTQERMWFMQQLAPENTAFNISMATRLRGPLNADLLERALADLVQRHESLRTVFQINEGYPVQLVLAQPSFKLARVNLKGFSPDQRESEVSRLCTAEGRRSFDLSTGPLLRAKLFQLDENDHVFALTIHHIACDNWSLGIIRSELVELYNAHLEGRGPDLADLQIQYPDFAAWQREWLRDEAADQRLAFWKERLKGLGPLELPTDRPRPPVQAFAGAEEIMDIEPELLDRLEQFSRSEGVTLFMTLAAAFQTMLYRYSSQDDIAVGIPIANRNHLQVENLVGAFINTLVLRSHVDGDMSFRDFLARVREASLEAFSYQDLPFDFLVQDLQPDRDLSRHPLVQVLFNVHNAPHEQTVFNGLEMEVFDFARGSSQVDLLMMIDPHLEKKLRLEYDTALFEQETVRRFLEHYRMLLEHIVEDPAQKLSQIDFLSDEERDLVLVEWNRTERPYPAEVCLPQLFETQVELTPEAVAAVYGDRTLTYGELNQRANQLAHYLREQGVGPDVVVALCVNRSLEMLVGLLGILKAGGAYVPLDPAYPEQRLQFMLEDSDARVIVTEESLRLSLPETSAAVVRIDEDWPEISRRSTDNPGPLQSPDNLAYIIYTSGSTGRPKGVMIAHRSLVNLLFSIRRDPGMTEKDVVIALTTLSFDIAAAELYVPLISGARIVIVSREDALDGSKLQEIIEVSQATFMQATPATWRLLLDSGWQGNSRLRTVTTGEAMPGDLPGRLLPLVDKLWNLYGPTETTIWSTGTQVTSKDGPVLIGRPVANTTTYILDQSLRPMPVGIPGELHIGGDGLARGYLNRPDLTAEKFIPNPFSDDPAARLYKTGDLARFLPNGEIECLGRIDSQVKLRGYRIELGEIEAVLSDHPDIVQATAAVREDIPGSPWLVAYYQPRHDVHVEPSALRAHLVDRLAEYMIPSVFVRLDDFPLTPSGKVDRKSLPAPEQTDRADTDRYVAPRTQVEETLARLWADVLGVERIGVNDNFFEMGGHSLLATRVIARMRQQLKVDIPLRSLFQMPTVAGIAMHILYDQETGTYEFREKGGMKAEHIIVMQPKGSRPPFFLVAGAHADEDEFLKFLSNMLPYLVDQPIYGFKARGLDGARDPHKSAEEMAADYIKDMRAFYPEGPYYIGGECVGGIVAYEMAQQLVEQGENVGLLILMDTYKPSWVIRYYHVLHYYIRKIRRIARLVFSDELSFADRVDMVLSRSRRRARMRRPSTEEERRESRIRRVQIDYPLLLQKYRPRKFPGKLTLIVNEELYARDPALGWKDSSRGGVEVLKVPGDHVTRLTEHARFTAERLRAALDQAQAQSRSRSGPRS